MRSMFSGLCGAIALMIAVALAMPSLAAASGHPNVVSAIKAQDKILNQLPLGKVKVSKQPTEAQVERVTKDLENFDTAAKHAISVVEQSSTENVQQRKGKSDWINGSKQQTRGISEMIAALKLVLAGHKKSFQTDYLNGLKTLVAGTKLGEQGDKLLGLPASD